VTTIASNTPIPFEISAPKRNVRVSATIRILMANMEPPDQIASRAVDTYSRPVPRGCKNRNGELLGNTNELNDVRRSAEK
jgi:hypothetical protein